MIKPLLKGLRIAPFVECTYCHALTEYSSPACLNCSKAIAANDDVKLQLVVLNTGARYTPFIECPNCERLLRIGVTRCPHCYEEIPDAYAISSATAVVVNTVACDTANFIESYNAFIPIAVIGMIVILVIDIYSSRRPVITYFVFLWSLITLVNIVLWLYRFGSFTLGDAEFVKAKRVVVRNLMLWLTILMVQVLAVFGWKVLA